MMNKLKLAFLLLVLSLAATAKDSSTIVVEGKSKISAVPEMVQFSLQFSVKDKEYVQCSDRILEKIEQLKILFVSHSIDTMLIKTQRFSINENREYNQELRRNVPNGYQATATVVISQKLSDPTTTKTYELIKNNFEASLNINFMLSEKQIKKLNDELILIAIQDAQQKAQSISKGLHVKLGKIANVQYGEPNKIDHHITVGYGTRSSYEKAADQNSANFNTLTPADIEMQTSVVVSWAIKQ